jgi:hypothetical protein
MIRRLAWALAAFDMLALTVATIVDPEPFLAVTLMFLLGIGAYVGIGAFLVGRVPGNPIGALMLATGTIGVAEIVIGMYGKVGALQDPAWPGVELAATLAEALFIYPVLIALVAIPLVFPDGTLPSPRFRWVVVLLATGMVGWLLGSVFMIRADLVVVVSLPPAFIGAIVAVVLRFRRGDPIVREQVKWLAAVVGLGATAVMTGLLLNEVNPDVSTALVIGGVLSLFALPFVIAIAILRYRLYEIDRIISRTLAYALVTGILAIVYAGGVVFLSATLSRIAEAQTIAVAGSTLVVFALFQPVLRRVRRAVDRRFDRAAYDAERTVAAFSERLRWETEMQRVTSDLKATAQAAVAPTMLGIWLRGGGHKT